MRRTRYPQCILAACLLPWREDLTLDEPVFRRHVRFAADCGYQNLYLMGTAGEGYALTDRQFQQVVRIFAEELSGLGLQPMVGVISLSMSQILERIRWAWEVGIREFQISLPSWGALNDRELMAFFQDVCGAFPDAAFLHYNLPRAKRILTGLEYRQIADAVPNLVATKNSTTDVARIADLMSNAPDLQHFFVEPTFALGALRGECSLLASYGLLFPQLIRRFFELGRERQAEPLMEMHQLISEINPALFRGVEKVFIDGAYDKLYVWLRDPGFPLRLQPPYATFSEGQAALIRRNFEAVSAGLQAGH